VLLCVVDFIHSFSLFSVFYRPIAFRSRPYCFLSKSDIGPYVYIPLFYTNACFFCIFCCLLEINDDDDDGDDDDDDDDNDDLSLGF